MVRILSSENALAERASERDRRALTRLSLGQLQWCADKRNVRAHGYHAWTFQDAELFCSTTRLAVALFGELPDVAAPEFPGDPELVRDLESCREALVSAVSACADQPLVRVQVLGLTLHRAWSFWTDQVLRDLARRGKLPRVELELTMLDPKWRELPRFSPDWKVQAQNMARHLPVSAPLAVKELGTFSVTLRTYRAQPTMHGALVDGRFVAASLLRWAGGRARGASEQYVLARKDGGQLGSYLTQFFEQSFAEIASGPISKRWPEEI